MDTTMNQQPTPFHRMTLEEKILYKLKQPGMTYHSVARYFEITKYEVMKVHSQNVYRKRLGFSDGIVMGSKRIPYYNDEMQYGKMPTYTINELSNGEREYLHRQLPEGWGI